MNQTLQKLLDATSHQFLDATEEYEKDHWMPNPLQPLELSIKKKKLMMADVTNAYGKRVQNGYEIIIKELEKQIKG